MKLRITHHSPAYWRSTFDNPPLNLMDPETKWYHGFGPRASFT